MRLRIDSGSRQGWEIEVPSSGLVIGCAPSSGLVVSDDERVADQHARIDLTPDGPVLTDLGSSEGTLVDGNRLTGPVLLRGGERIAVGGTVLVVPPPTVPPMAPPPPPPGAWASPPADEWAAPAAGWAPVQPADDPGFVHFLRYLGVSLAVGVLAIVTLQIGGLVWGFRILSATGHRKRDVVNPVANVRAGWRYTARSVYWTPREDRPSYVISGWRRPAAIATGYVGYPLAFIALVSLVALVAGDDDNRNWTAANRAEFSAGLLQAGAPEQLADCVTDHFASAYPDGVPDEDDSRFASVAQSAFSTCAGSAAPPSDPGGSSATGSSTAIGCNDLTPAPNPARPTFSAPPPLTIDPAKAYIAVIDTSCGKITVALDAKLAPKTVNNFVFLASQKFFDGLTWHRTVQGFVIQGGDPDGNGGGGPGYEFEDELPTDGYQLGSLAMANAGPDTNGSQFFIVTGPDGTQLPNRYSRFGTVTSGLDVAQKLESFARADQAPARPLYILSVTISAG